jgi:hypothetical protein
MSSSEQGNTDDRAELLQRLELMETMIAEGRSMTVGNGWIFVLWGVIYLLPTAWLYLLPSRFANHWAWPICLCMGYLVMFIGLRRQGRCVSRGSVAARAIQAVWSMMGLSCGLAAFGVMLSGSFVWKPVYSVTIFMMIAMAQATSAMILRWKAQWIMAALWWGGAVAVLVRPNDQTNTLVLLVEVLGMIVFGLYAMSLERSSRVQHG